ncbi:MAG: ribosome silencing factor [Niameybacter sp.]
MHHILNNKKLESIKILDVHEITTLADIFIIVVGTNTSQTRALVDEVEAALSKENIEARQKEGYQTAQWILMDYKYVIVHVLYKEDAEFYRLDRLWQDGKILCF